MVDDTPRADSQRLTEPTLTVDGSPMPDGARHRRRGQDQRPSTLHLSRGVAVGRYLVLEPLGAGGMGQVYTAYDPDLDRKVALKLLRPVAGDHRRRQARLWREAKSLARLSHPQVVTVFDVGTVGEHLFVAMELVAGLDLDRWLLEAPRSSYEILAVFVQAGRGLAAAHDAGLIHRDFKPGNVLVGNDGRVRVCDFGLAASWQDSSCRLAVDELEQATPERLETLAGHDPMVTTHTGAVLGTPAFMAPEQRQGQAAQPAADQYGFCVALYRALYGRWPESHPRGAEPGDGRLPDRLASKVEAAIRRGLEPRPELRHPSLRELLSHLERARRGSRFRGSRAAIAAAVTAAVITLALALAVVLRQPADDSCSGGSDRMAGVWDHGQQERLESAFALAASPYGRAALTATVSTLNGYRDGWIEMYGEACRSARRGEQSIELLDRRMACLDERRLEMRSLVDIMTRDAAAAARGATLAAASLPVLSQCADAVALLAPLPAPDSATQGAVTQSRARLAKIRAMRVSGLYDDALAAAEDVVATAELVGYWPLTAEALFELARVHDVRGQVEPAIHSLEQALLAAEAGRHDRVAVESFLRLVRLVGHEKMDVEGGERYADMGRALLSGLGERRRLEAMLEGHLGLLSYRRGDYERAIEHHQRALALADTGTPPHDLERAATLIRLANAERAGGRLAEAERHTERAVELYSGVHGDSHPEVALALERLGGIAVERGQLRQALRLRQRATDILRRGLGADHPQLADTLTNLGSVLLALGEPAPARRAFLEAARIYELHHSTEKLAVVASNLGTAALDEGLDAEALDYFARALSLQISIDGPDHPNTALANFNLAEAYNETGDPARALEHHRTALEVWRRRLAKDHFLLAHGAAGEGRALLGLGQLARAAVVLEQALERWRGAGRAPMFAAETGFLLAQALWPLGEHSRALELARAARPLFATSAAHRDDLATVDQWLSERSAL